MGSATSIPRVAVSTWKKSQFGHVFTAGTEAEEADLALAELADRFFGDVKHIVVPCAVHSNEVIRWRIDDLADLTSFGVVFDADVTLGLCSEVCQCLR